MHALPAYHWSYQPARLFPRLTDPWSSRSMAFTGPCAGRLDTAAYGFENSPSLSSVAALRRHGTGASGGSTSLHPGTATQGGDPWAWALAIELGLLVSVEMKGHTTTAGGVLLTRRLASSPHGGRHPRSMTHGPEPPCQRLDRCPWRRRRGAANRSSHGSSPSAHQEAIAPAV
jgi:hypothetical protein